MRLIFLSSFMIFPLCADAQFKRHRNSLVQHSPLEGTWKVMSVTHLNDGAPDTNGYYYSSIRNISSYYFFGEHLRAMQEYSITNDSIGWFNMENIQSFGFYKNDDEEDTVRPVILRYEGVWCSPYEGWSRWDSIRYLNESTVDFLVSYKNEGDSEQIYINHLKKIAPPDTLLPDSISEIFGEWHCVWNVNYPSINKSYHYHSDFTLSDLMFTIERNTDVLCFREPGSNDFNQVIESEYKVIRYDGHIVLYVEKPYELFISINPISANEMWLSAFYICDSQYISGSYHYFRNKTK